MTINCVWEHNGRDTLLYAVDFVGAFCLFFLFVPASRPLHLPARLPTNRPLRKKQPNTLTK